jgi:pimeloyl-ACP methyl ester carboxylesterase
MVRLQRDGIYPTAFAAIDAPVLMLHGDADPHPGRLTSEDLRTYIPHLEYRELPKCGHSPWLERQARHTFFETLKAWLAARFQPTRDDAGYNRLQPMALGTIAKRRG